ncbi:MAG: galactokinase, partial [Spirochaetales bacterium]|nr:galactokinase [Spirochaetales bacterium]
IPIAAGLSSSSAMVVATAEAAVAINDLDLAPQDFVDLCGEGEWFVGSRGGAGDHAAMKYGKKGHISQLEFFPFGLKQTVPFPDGYSLLIANTFVEAKKSDDAKDIFNQRIAEYDFSFMLFKHLVPTHVHQLHRLRDINSKDLLAPPSAIYRMLLKIPECLSLKEMLAILPKELHEKVIKIASSHQNPEMYKLRSVLLYGIAECERSRIAEELLSSGRFDEFGQLMRASHNGDRVCALTGTEMMEIQSPCDDVYLESLIADLRSEDPSRVFAAQLQQQPGGYACSTKEADFIVDTAMGVPGVIGGQLSGAGLGGCVMILAKQEAITAVQDRLNEEYYSPRGLSSGITVCVPVAGSMVIEI